MGGGSDSPDRERLSELARQCGWPQWFDACPGCGGSGSGNQLAAPDRRDGLALEETGRLDGPEEGRPMRRLQRRLTVLGKELRLPSLAEQIVEVALDTGQGDFMFDGREWLPCPNAAELFERSDLPITFYTGMSLAMLDGPAGQAAVRNVGPSFGASDAGIRPAAFE
jgi:hypothetical protein